MTTLNETARSGVFRGHDVPLGLYLHGSWTDAEHTFTVTNPSTGQSLAEVADGTARHARAALDAAAAAQEPWRSMAPRERASLFHAAHRRLVERAEAFADLMVLESGKPRAEAMGEFRLSAEFFLWYAEQIAHLHGTFGTAAHGGYRIVTTHRPVGPCLLITPWNFPLLMPARKAGAALAAGCTVVIKSAAETPLTAALFVQTLHEAGFPPGVLNLVHTSDAASVSAPLLEDSRIRKISFTGSTAVGAALLERAAGNIVNCSMELGGDGPFVVLPDADLDLAVREAVNCKFRNAGQACVAANRIILHRDIAEEFTERFLAATNALCVGGGFDEAVDVGPIISPRQLDRVDGLVRSFTDSGAELLTGGRRVEGAGTFYQPTVLRFDRRDAGVCDQELFAPVAALFTAESAGDAVRFANDTSYGLAAYVFTKELSTAFAVSERLEFGMVGINRGIMADPAAAFGGVKQSGLGREGGHDGIYEFLESQYFAVTVDENGVQA